eukprot:6199671-Pleurochrysis_carterae.AAC.1
MRSHRSVASHQEGSGQSVQGAHRPLGARKRMGQGTGEESARAPRERVRSARAGRGRRRVRRRAAAT